MDDGTARMRRKISHEVVFDIGLKIGNEFRTTQIPFPIPSQIPFFYDRVTMVNF